MYLVGLCFFLSYGRDMIIRLDRFSSQRMVRHGCPLESLRKSRLDVYSWRH